MRRPLLIATIATLAALAWAAPTLAGDPAPVAVTLLSPRDGAAFPVTGPGRVNPTFSWRVDFAQPPSGSVTISFQLSTDPAFRRPGYAERRVCPAAAPACLASVEANGTVWITGDECNHLPRPSGCATRPIGTLAYYWRVTVAREGHAPVVSPAWRVDAVMPGDADRDGILDAADNCPRVRNPLQENSDSTPAGDACEPDRVRPRVRVVGVRLRRGERGDIPFYVADNRTMLAVDARLYLRGRLFLRSRRHVLHPRWAERHTFYVIVTPRVPSGAYRACVRATDKSGNSAESCARVRIG